MNPTQNDVHVNVPLSNFSLMFQQDAEAFVADKVFPIVPVEKQTDLYYTYSRADFNRNMVKERAAGVESEGSGYRLDANATYSAKVYALHKDIPDQVRANADSMLNPDLEATKFLTTQILIDKETRFVTNYFGTGIWTSESTPTKKWGAADSTPIEDVRLMKRNVQLASGGYRPNKLVLGRGVYDTLLDHPDIIDRIKFAVKESGDPAVVSKNVLAQLFEVQAVEVMDSIQNTTGEGVAETNAFIAGKNALLCYVGQPSLMGVSAGFTFTWTGMFGSSAGGTRLLSYYMPWIASTRIEIEAAYAQKVVSADLGGFFLNAIA